MNITGSNKKNKSSDSLMSVKLSLQIIMFVFSVVVFLSLITGGSLFGTAGKAINSFILGIFGHSSYPIFVAVIYSSVKLFGRRKYTARKKSVVCVFILFISAILCYHLLTTTSVLTASESLSQYLSSCFDAGSLNVSGASGGGVLFGIVVYPLYELFQLTGSYIIYSLIFAITVLILFSSRNRYKESDIQGVKEYPSNFFNDSKSNKEYSLPGYDADSNRPVETDAVKQIKEDDNIILASKKLFVGFIDDYINIKNKKSKQSNKSFDILYTSPKSVDEDNNTSQNENISKANNTLGGASYVDTFGDDLESKKKYILTPAENILHPYADYGGLSSRIFPININQKEQNDNEKPPRINHNIDGKIDINTSLQNDNSLKSPRLGRNLGNDMPKDGQNNSINGSSIINNFENGAGRGLGRNLSRGGRNLNNDNGQETDNGADGRNFSGGRNLNNDNGQETDNGADGRNFSGGRNLNNDNGQETDNGADGRNFSGGRNLNNNNGQETDNGAGRGLGRNLSSGGRNLNNDNGQETDNGAGRGLGRNLSSGGRNQSGGRNFDNSDGVEDNVDGQSIYQQYANKNEDIHIEKTENIKPSAPQKSSVKPDFLNNLAELRQKYVNAANEKSTFTNDKPEELPKINIKPENAPKIEIAKKADPLKMQTEISGKQEKPEIKSPYVAPLMSLMNDIFFDPNEVAENYEEKARILENTLNEFKVPAKVVSVTPGPAVTRYELQMPPGVPVSKLTSRANDIAMCLASNGDIRIEAPIPGKSLLGIELPNKKRQKVGIKEVIDSEEFINNKSPVAFGLGKDITGKNIILDFRKIPHLLVAGSTGSGKSVCLNTLIISIIYKSSPEDVRLILVDPKRVEFNIYNGLPHLMLKEVITDTEKAISAFNWAIKEMDRRFEMFKNNNAKDIDSYNDKIKVTGEQKLPRILIIVDELAELMMVNKKELEEKIKKISQLSRAAGIHLILATQRPSVDIITGVIKANLSSRVSFKLMTQADSRTILDCSGAEKLLGEGDMIFLSNNMPKPIRLQGPYISMTEVENIVDYIKKNNKAYFDETIEQIISNPVMETEHNESSEPMEEDKFFIEALKLAIETGQISISMVQRRFAVGYSRAGKIIDDMEQQHFISAFEGSKPRQVLITREEFNKRFGAS